MKICPSCKSKFSGGEVFCPNDGARLTTASQLEAPREGDDPLIGVLLSERYMILRRIGEGGMGLVYEAEHVAIEKRVALKVLRDDFSGRPEVVERFKQEAKSASKIGNEHIVDISDFGVTPNGASYFVMELLEGEDLANVLAREGQLPLSRAADIVMQCCKALGAAHSKGIVHRDMKPENIFLTMRDGRQDFVKIVDFGIAKMSDIETAGAPGRKLTKTGMIFGTPEYMSPEQSAGKPLDHRVDIYALAVIFFEMVTGRVPFVGDTFMGILTQHMFEDPPRLDAVSPHVRVPEAVVSFIYKGLAKEPDARFRSCDEMHSALAAALAGRVSGSPTVAGYGETVKPGARSPRVTLPTQDGPELPRVEPRRGRGLTLAIAGALLVGGVGSATWYLMSRPPAALDDEPRPIAAGANDAGLVIAEPPRDDADDAGASVASGDAIDAGPAMVTVRVDSSPAGARVFVVGRGQVCDETPCSFPSPAGAAITVRAQRGRSEAEMELAPDSNTAIRLAMTPVRRPRERGESETTGTGGGGGSGDLKIPDIFRRP